MVFMLSVQDKCFIQQSWSSMHPNAWADTITTIVTELDLEKYYNEQYLLAISQRD